MHRNLSMYCVGVAKVEKNPLSGKELPSLAEKYRALGDETRLGIILSVAASDGQEACVCDLTPDTGLAQSTVSHHLKMLVDAGLLTRTQRGKWAFYSLTSVARELLK